MTSATAPVILLHRSLKFVGNNGKYIILKRSPLNSNGVKSWPPRSSPVKLHLDFFLWWFVKDNVYFPPLPADVHDLWARIKASWRSHARQGMLLLLCYIWKLHWTVTLIHQIKFDVFCYIWMYLVFIYHLLMYI